MRSNSAPEDDYGSDVHTSMREMAGPGFEGDLAQSQQDPGPELERFHDQRLTDEINKAMREKHMWEVQIRNLEGPNYMRGGGKVYDEEGREIPGGGKGYRWVVLLLAAWVRDMLTEILCRYFGRRRASWRKRVIRIRCQTAGRQTSGVESGFTKTG